jgi:nucleotide-binding universal stress UspA family protein
MFKTLLIPIDDSVFANVALPYALHLARTTGVRLLLLHATGDLARLTRMEAELGVAVTLEPHLDALRRCGIDTTPGPMGSLSPTAILRVVREDHVDLIVMSIQGYVADDVLRRVEVPVLLVPPACARRWQADRPLRLLVPLDGLRHSETALVSARELAETVSAELLLVRAIWEPKRGSRRPSSKGLSIMTPVSDRPLYEARLYLEGVARKQGTTFASIDTLVDLGEPARVIVDAARHHDVDLIVMATHGRLCHDQLALSSVAATVLQRANLPVLLSPPNALALPSAERLDTMVHR